jgi:ankyrin repeat protein
MSTSAKQFFEGEFLALGQAIEENDLAKLEILARELEALDGVHNEGMTFSHFALLHKNAEALKVLTCNGASPHIEIEGVGSVFFSAVMAEDTKYLKSLLECGVDPNSTDSTEMPIFFHAALKKDLSALKLLVASGLDLNQTSKTGRPVAMHVFYRNRYDNVEFLINAGVDLSIQDQQGYSLGYSVQFKIDQQRTTPPTAAYKRLLELKQLLKSRGVTFPVPKPTVSKS